MLYCSHLSVSELSNHIRKSGKCGTGHVTARIIKLWDTMFLEQVYCLFIAEIHLEYGLHSVLTYGVCILSLVIFALK